jgi:hypothetical protein
MWWNHEASLTAVVVRVAAAVGSSKGSDLRLGWIERRLGIYGEIGVARTPKSRGFRSGRQHLLGQSPARPRAGGGRHRWHTSPGVVTPSTRPGCQCQERGESTHAACWASLLTRAARVKELGLRGNKAEQGGNCPAGQKNERVGEFLFIFFPKFPKQIFKLVLNSL